MRVSLAEKLLNGNLARYLTTDFLSALIGFVLGSYILVKLGPESLGRYTLFITLVGLFSSFCHGAASRYLFKHFFEHPNPNALITATLLTKTGFTVVAFIVYAALQANFDEYFLHTAFFAIVVAQTLNGIVSEMLRLNQHLNLFVLYMTGRRLLFFVAALMLIWTSRFDLETLILAYFVVELAATIWGVQFVVRRVGFRLRWVKSDFEANLRSALFLFPHKLFRTINDNIDIYLVQFLAGTSALGIYRMLRSIVSPIPLYAKSVNRELTILFSQQSSGIKSADEAARVGRQSLLWLLVLNILTAILAVGYDGLVYDFGTVLIDVLPWLFVLGNLSIVYYALFNAAYYQEHPSHLYFNALNLVLLIAPVLAWRHADWQLMEVSIILVAANLLSLVLLLYATRENESIGIYRNFYWTCFFCAGAAFLFSQFPN